MWKCMAVQILQCLCENRNVANFKAEKIDVKFGRNLGKVHLM